MSTSPGATNAMALRRAKLPFSVLTRDSSADGSGVLPHGSRYGKNRELSGPRWTRTTYLRVISTALCQLS